MKITIFILLIFCCINFSAYSQFNTFVSAYAGPELAFASSFNPEVVKNYETRPGFAAGIRFQHTLKVGSIVWGLEYAQMNFVQNNHEFNNWPSMEPGYYTLNASQIRVPLLFQISVGNKKSQFFANAGPSVIFSFAASPTKEGSTFGDDENTRLYPTHLVNTFNLGAVVGAGYSYEILPWLKLFTEARFIVPMFATNKSGNGSSYDIRTLSLSWNTGISFRMRK